MAAPGECELIVSRESRIVSVHRERAELLGSRDQLWLRFIEQLDAVLPSHPPAPALDFRRIAESVQ